MQRFSTSILVVYALFLGALLGLGHVWLAREGNKLHGQMELFVHIAIIAGWIGVAFLCLAIVNRFFHTLVLILGIVIAVGFVLLGLHATHQHEALEAKGVDTEGVAVKRIHLVTNHYTDGIYTGQTDDYTIDYTFTAAGGNPYSAQKKYVSKDLFDKTETHQAIPIKYLPDDPTLNEVDLPSENFRNEGTPWGFYIAAIVAFLFALRIWNRRAVTKPVASGPVRTKAGVPKAGVPGGSFGRKL